MNPHAAVVHPLLDSYRGRRFDEFIDCFTGDIEYHYHMGSRPLSGKAPTTPDLHAAMTSSGPVTRNIGAANTGSRIGNGQPRGAVSAAAFTEYVRSPWRRRRRTRHSRL